MRGEYAMKMHGFCEGCNKVKLVQVKSANMVRLAMNQPIFGLCDECHRAEVEAAKHRHPAYRRGNA